MTNLIRFNPSSDLRRMQSEIDRVFESFFPARSDANGDSNATVWSPRVDLVENENAYTIHADLPGIPREELKINFQDGMLIISGERRVEKSSDNDNYVRVERSYGHFYRSFSLPKAVDIDGTEAHYENGVLTVRVPKAEESKPRQIQIS